MNPRIDKRYYSFFSHFVDFSRLQTSIWSTLVSSPLPWLGLLPRERSWRILKVSHISLSLVLFYWAINNHSSTVPVSVTDYSFEQFVVDFNHEFSPKEYAVRKSLFNAELARVIQHNSAQKGTWEEVSFILHPSHHHAISLWPQPTWYFPWRYPFISCYSMDAIMYTKKNILYKCCYVFI